jgi:hypothetical protein
VRAEKDTTAANHNDGEDGGCCFPRVKAHHLPASMILYASFAAPGQSLISARISDSSAEAQEVFSGPSGL